MKKAVVVSILTVLLMIGSIIVYIELPFVSDSAIGQALSSLNKLVSDEHNRGTLVVVDYSRPSHTKRLSVIDLSTGVALDYFRVTHGKNSGVVIPTEFSNTRESYKSPLGLFEVGEPFDGKYGTSLRLLGLEPAINDNALVRGIIIHSAPYASKKSMILNWKEGFRLGRSGGCFVLSEEDYNIFNRLLKKPVYLYSYADIK